MKDYYDILDIPLNASIEQMRTRYKQLVRIYHPDRFSNALDKIYAEQKLKEVNEAYAYLTSDIEGVTLFNTLAKLPEPTVQPALLDFGALYPGDQQVLRFEVGNTGGPASGVTFVCSEENSWFRISNGKRIDQSKTLPMSFEVVADIRPTFPARHYGGWIEISMDGVKTRVELQAEVQEAPPKPSFQERVQQLPRLRFDRSHRLLLPIGVFCLLAILLNTRFPQATFDLFQSLKLTQSAQLVSAASQSPSTPLPVEPTMPPPTLTVPPTVEPPTVEANAQVVESVAIDTEPSPTATPEPLPPEQFVSPAQAVDSTILSPEDEETASAAIAAATALAIEFPETATAVPPTVAPTASLTPVPPTPAPPTPAPPTATATTATTAVPTATPTVAPTNTPLPSPTPTLAATATPAALPTATALPAGGLYEILLADGTSRLALTLEIPPDHTVNVRYAWDIRSPAVAVLLGGTRIPAIGRSLDSVWVEVALPNGKTGWIFSEVINPDFTQLEQLPLTLAPQWP